VRTDGRTESEIRPITITRGYTRYAEGSVLIEWGQTRVICTAMVEARVPRHCAAANTGWITAEYGMLPGANPERRTMHGHPPGRTQEIQRLIGRALRAAVDLTSIPGRTIWVDCHVVQADGGTRTASITGGFVALVDALRALKEREQVGHVPLLHAVGAVSVGIVDGRAMVDLCSEEDKAAAVDMNVVMTHSGRFIEVQGTAERQPFDADQLSAMLELARAAMAEVAASQRNALGDRLPL